MRVLIVYVLCEIFPLIRNCNFRSCGGIRKRQLVVTKVLKIKMKFAYQNRNELQNSCSWEFCDL